ncbi:MAG: phosphonate metabolism protein/1,5-bisphosphokinase (PRPP-forming) PhnN [Roseovarius sp.]|jgi:ribose 1,5-bisphosphokinase|nr:phosphonate metabolism protein/1,5-bisphosphokinase (PRPP-forming) PhnN [Roseovarius sp.]
MSGRFIAIVGPSGVGKDSVMQAMAARDPRLGLARRVITRPGDAGSDAGGEDFEGVSEAAFEAQETAGAFALSWRAHGHCYAIPATVDAVLATGRDVLGNLSRSVLIAAQARFAQVEVIALSADHTTLSARLYRRGRETDAEITRRLERATFTLPQGVKAHVVENNGRLEDCALAILAHLYPAAMACNTGTDK